MTIENVQPPRPVQQPRVVDVSRPGRGLTVEIDASEAAELLLSIATLLVDDDRAASRGDLLHPLSGGSEHVLPAIVPADSAALAERDVEAKRELVRSVPPEQVVERLAPGIQWVPGPEIDRVVLFPAYSPRPWVYMSEHRRVKIFCPPITLAREPAAPGDPAELVRIYKALGDASRLKLLRRLQDGPISLTEAAQEIGLAKSPTHHHLALLRHAGFGLTRG